MRFNRVSTDNLHVASDLLHTARSGTGFVSRSPREVKQNMRMLRDIGAVAAVLLVAAAASASERVRQTGASPGTANSGTSSIAGPGLNLTTPPPIHLRVRRMVVPGGGFRGTWVERRLPGGRR